MIPRMLRQKNSQAGFTLVELMVSMVISSIIIFFLFSIQTRMGRAYQGQGTVSEINQNLQSAKQRLLSELRMAGFGLDTLSNVSVASAIDSREFTPGFVVSNNAYNDGNDSFRVLYSNPSNEVQATAINGSRKKLTVESVGDYSEGTRVVIASRSDACLLVVTKVKTSNSKLFFKNKSPYNGNSNSHCSDVFAAVDNGDPVRVRGFESRSYRIDPNRAGEGYLQMSPSGEIEKDDWQDMGVGFTNLQIATRYFESGDADDLDNDGDAERDWYSGDNQEEGSPVRPLNAVLIQVSISIEARSPHGTRGSAASSTTPAYTVVGSEDNNSIGDWGQDCSGAPTDPCGIHLSATPDASRPDRYKGEFIYRSTTSTVDMRNMGVGQ